MEDKVVIVTGSSAGIGEATVIKFAQLGCKVVVHGVNEERIKQVARRCAEASPKNYKPLEVVGDITIEKNAESLINATVKLYGRLDILINNAGLYQPKKVDEPGALKTFHELLQINLISVVALTTFAVPHLKKSKGCIVNVSSNLHAKCIEGGFAYSTAKAGLTMFTKSIAVDLAPDVRVNSVSPGPIATLMPTRVGMNIETYRDMVASACLVNRVGEPEEVARVILFLASPDATFMTGTDIIIDGGSTIKPAGPAMRRPQ